MREIAYLFVLFCIFVSYSTAESLEDITIPPVLLDSVKKYNEAQSGYYSEPQKKISSDDISQGGDSTIFFSSPDSPIKIRKLFNPGNKTNYLLGDPIGVYVEVSSTNKNLADINILEVIDDDLSVLSVSEDYGKISSLSEICDYYRDLNNDDYLEAESCINEGFGCRFDSLNKTDISFNKNELEYKLLIFNLSDNCSSSELNAALKIIKDEFKIPWAMQGSASYNKSMTGIKINKINDLDFVDILFNNSTNNALVNISNQRFYRFKAELKDNVMTINETEVALKFSFDSLGRSDLFAYNYYIIPKKPGNFNIMTLVRSYGRSDIKYISTIEIKEPTPQFEITPRPRDLIITRSFGPLYLAYDITYLGGASEPDLNNVKIKLENDGDYYNCSFEDGIENATTMNFTKYKTAHINTKVEFKNSGMMSIPGIYINDKLYSFRDVKIDVYTTTGRIASIITDFNFIVSAFIGLIFFIIFAYTGRTLKQHVCCWIFNRDIIESTEKDEKEEPDL